MPLSGWNIPHISDFPSLRDLRFNVKNITLFLQSSTMNQSVNHSIRIGVLINYLLVGTIGHIGIFTFFLFWTQGSFFSRCRSGPPPSVQVYWTQHKHIPVSPKISASIPIVLTVHEDRQHPEYYSFISLVQCQILDVKLFSFLAFRAPPQTRFFV